MVIVFAFTVFTVDVGYITLSRSQLQNAVDAGALAAVQELNHDGDQSQVVEKAMEAAQEVCAIHRAGDHASVSLDGNLGDVEFGRRIYDPTSGEYSYLWGSEAVPYNVVRVTARRSKIVNQQGAAEDNQLPLFFGPLFGAAGATIQAEAIATFQPRDIMLVLDFSASMNDDSELMSISALGQQAIEDNIYQMWDELGSPTYGNMDFTPDWVTVQTKPTLLIPSMSITWTGPEVLVSSPIQLTSVHLEFTDGTTQLLDNLLSILSPLVNVSFSGTGGNNGKLIKMVRVTSVLHRLLTPGEEIDFFNNNVIKRGLGLDTVAYPYPSGSWNDYIEYARSHANWMPWYDGDVFNAGYRRKFGILTLINFWNKNKPMYSETPDLWQTSQQPAKALKDSVDVMIDYLTAVSAEDNVGLSVYTHPSTDGAILEGGLGTPYGTIKSITRQRQAGHYDRYTNIGAGIRQARLELEANSRPKALKMIILITDGQANRSLTSASPNQFAVDEAQLAADSHIKIMTISLGAGADSSLMQQIADIGKGEHFNIPGGQSVSQYETELKEVFAKIAADRPLKLIQIP